MSLLSDLEAKPRHTGQREREQARRQEVEGHRYQTGPLWLGELDRYLPLVPFIGLPRHRLWTPTTLCSSALCTETHLSLKRYTGHLGIEAGESALRGPWFHMELESSLGYTRPCLKTTNRKMFSKKQSWVALEILHFRPWVRETSTAC